MKLYLARAHQFTTYINQILDQYQIEVTQPHAKQRIDQFDEQELKQAQFDTIRSILTDLFSVKMILRNRQHELVSSIFFLVHFCDSRIVAIFTTETINREERSPDNELLRIFGVVYMYIYGVDYLLSDAINGNSKHILRRLGFSSNLLSDRIHPNIDPHNYHTEVARKYAKIFSPRECQLLFDIIDARGSISLDMYHRRVDRALDDLVNKYKQKITTVDPDGELYVYDYGRYQIDTITHQPMNCQVKQSFNFWMDLEHIQIGQLIAYLEVVRARLKGYLTPEWDQLIRQMGVGLYLVMNQNPRQLRRLSGPIKFDYINVFNKSILLLGEEHCMDHMCPRDKDQIGHFDVVEWIEQIIGLSDHCIDIFVEDAYIEHGTLFCPTGAARELSTYHSPIAAIQDKFIPCKRNEDCYQGKVRYHYIDIRQMYAVGSKVTIEFPLAQIILDAGDHYHGLHPITYSEDTYRQLMRHLIGLDESAATAQLYLETCEYFAEQYHITWTHPWAHYHQLRQSVIRHIHKEVNKMDQLPITQTQFLEYLCDAIIESYQADIFKQNYHHTYDGLTIIQQDAYFLARLFSVYDWAPTKATRGPIYCRHEQAKRATHIIVYVGGIHQDIYVRFMRRCFGVQPEISALVTAGQQCLTLDQPFDFFKGWGGNP